MGEKVLGTERIIEVLESLNPTADFNMLECNAILVTGIEFQKIKCPEGYYLTEENVLTNGDEQTCGTYDAFQLI